MKRWTLYAAAGLLALIVVFFASRLNHTNTTRYDQKILQSGTLLPGQEALVPFTLIDKNNHPFTNEQLKGRWSYLFFGYTHCPDICPISLQMMTQTLHILEKSAAKGAFQAVFISVDPQRDSPENLKTYVEYFDPGIIGVTGEKTELDRLTRQLGIFYMRAEDAQDPQQYQVDHSAQILVINPEGEFAAVLSPPHKPDIMAEDLQRLRQAYKG